MNQNNILKLIFVKKMYEHEKLPWYNFRCSHNHICNIILILKYQMYIHIDRYTEENPGKEYISDG